MNININLNSPTKPAKNIESLCALLNRKVNNGDFFKVDGHEILFGNNSNVRIHTFLIGLLVILSAKYYDKYGFFVSLGNDTLRGYAGGIKSLDNKGVSVVYDFIESLDLKNVNIEIN